MLFYQESDNIKKLREIVQTLEKEVVVDGNMFECVQNICQDGYWDWDIKNNTKYFTPELKAQLGYQDDEIDNSVGAMEELILPKDLPYLSNELKLHFKTMGKHPFKVVVRFKHKCGDVVKILCRGKVVEWDENGEPLRMYGSHVNVTDI